MNNAGSQHSSRPHAWLADFPSWALRIEATGEPGGPRTYQADLLRGGERMCRIDLSGRFETPEEAKAALYLRLRACLDDFHFRSYDDRDARLG